MFSLIGLSNTLTKTEDLGIPIINTTVQGRGGVPLVRSSLTDQNQYNSSFSISPTTTATTTVGQPLTVTVDALNVNEVFIDGVRYVVSNSGDPGTFFYNNSTQTLTVIAATTVKPKTFINIYGTKEIVLCDEINIYNYNNLIIRDNLTPTPNVIEAFNLLNAINITQNFNDYPTATANLICRNDQLANVRAIFKDSTERWIIGKIPFRLQTYTEQVYKLEEYPEGYTEVNLSFEGWWNYLLNLPIFIRRRRNTPDLGCGISNTKRRQRVLANSDSIDPCNKNNIRVSIATLAARAGVPIKGCSGYLTFPNTTPANATITLADAISRLISERPDIYAMYSKVDAVYLLKWRNPPNHSLVTANRITSEVNNTSNLDQTITHFPTTNITWKTKDEEDASPGEDNSQNNKPEYEAIDYGTYSEVNGDADYQVPYVDVLDGYNYNYDVGGQTKTKTTTFFSQGAISREVTEIWGFSYASDEITNLQSNGRYLPLESSAGHWKMVEFRTLDYVYDTATGYLLGTITAGWKLARYEPETLEENIVLLQAEGGNSLLEIPRYRWFKVPIQAFTAYTLVQFRSYYGKADDNDQRFTIYQYCDENGNQRAGVVKNPNFVEPRFAIKKETYYRAYSSRQDPVTPFREPGQVLPPRMQTGEIKREIEELKIKIDVIGSRFKSVVGINALTGNPIVRSEFEEDTRESYITFSKIQTAQDGSFLNSAESTSISTTEGRPGEHTKRPPRYRVKEDGDTLELTEQLRERTRKKEYDYFCYSAPYTGKEDGGSKFYQASSFASAKRLARIDYERRVFQNSGNTSFTTLYIDNFYEGEIFNYNYNAETVKGFRIKSISKIFNLKGTDEDGNRLITAYTSFNGNADYLDKLLPLNSTRRQRKDPNDNPNIELVIFLGGFYKDSILKLPVPYIPN